MGHVRQPRWDCAGRSLVQVQLPCSGSAETGLGSPRIGMRAGPATTPHALLEHPRHRPEHMDPLVMPSPPEQATGRPATEGDEEGVVTVWGHRG